MINYYKYRSINTQLRLIMAICLIISFFSIAALVYRSASDILLKSILTEHESKIEGIATVVSEQFDAYFKTTKTLESTFEHGYLNRLKFNNKKVMFKNQSLNDVTFNGESIINTNTIVDCFTHDTGAIATLFLPTQNNWIRVTTSLKNPQGERVIGTMLGTSHPGYTLLCSS